WRSRRSDLPARSSAQSRSSPRPLPCRRSSAPGCG
ncbi:MAG: hypothetical protein AVDCRST_MAG88-2364, partial [uncultured Thermomicrobiales bacterium]